MLPKLYNTKYGIKMSKDHTTETKFSITLQWDSLACRRTKASLIQLYKINRGLVEVPTTMLSQSDRRT